jgi:pimeloyl-ACP methyl ester carboxylesterase
MKAIKRWGRQTPSDLSAIRQPVLVANGENDRTVPSQNTVDLAARLPKSELVPLYPDSAHGGDLAEPRGLRRKGARVPRVLSAIGCR